MFVEPGEQLHGMFFPFSVYKAKTPSRTSLAERLPTIWIVSFWAIASGFLGAFASYARPPLPRRTRLNPLRRVLEAGGRWLVGRLDEPRKKVVFAVWVLIILGVVTIGWYARELIYHQANRIELGLTEDNRYAVPYSPYLPYPYTYEPQREVRDAQMDRLKELLEEGQRLDQQGKHYDAQQRYRDALSLVARIRPRIHRDVATIHQLLAHSFYLHGWHAKAAEQYRKVLPILVAVGEGDSDTSVMAHNNYAQHAGRIGRNVPGQIVLRTSFGDRRAGGQTEQQPGPPWCMSTSVSSWTSSDCMVKPVSITTRRSKHYFACPRVQPTMKRVIVLSVLP